MSLCMVVRTPDGGTLMAADTALSTMLDGQRYRLSDLDDEEKIIEHNGVLIACSGEYEKCKKIRSYIRGMTRVNLTKVQEYAQSLFRHDTSDDSTGILVCWEDGSLVGMLSAQDFKLTPIPWKKDRVDVFALGFHMEEAYRLVDKYYEKYDYARNVIGNVYNDLLCEAVGGHMWLYSRREANQPWKSARYIFNVEPKCIKRITTQEAKKQGQWFPYCQSIGFSATHQYNCPALLGLNDGEIKAHGIINAEDFLLHDGTSMKSALTEDRSKIRGENIDARGINILDDNGQTVLYIDKTGIHWTPKYSPFKTQYSVSENGPWHDTYAPNDEYRRESTDGGITWGPGIKYVAKDGRDGANGSDANVDYANIKAALQKAASIPTAFMSVDEMGAPEIFGGKIYGAEIYAGGVGMKGGQIIGLTDGGIDIWNGNKSRVLTIAGNANGAHLTTDYNALSISTPYLSFGGATNISFEALKTDFTKVDEVDFTGVKTTGLHYTLA